MTVDISRVSFVPRKNYSAPIEQQGRVALDADGTEGWAIQDRRWRSGTLDQAGRVHVPVTLPDSFLIDVVAGQLVINPGRLYVDGLQAENHGGAPNAFDPVLAETTGTAAIRFDQQPYRPGFAPGAPAPGRHVVLLDVWQRTVTPIEDPSLIEPAIGVDTTGRVQTVWQVRTLPNIGNADCSTPDGELPGWNALTAPSTGRLSSRAHIGPPQTDPCLLPPGSGYTGLENRTYRVEIHDQSAAGAFRFKWAMYNATVASPVLAVPAANILRVARVARDDVMRFNPGDWVEITDDRRELEGQPGVMAQIQAVNDAQQTITLTAPLPAGTVALLGGGGNAADPQFHPRVRKWDQAGLVRDSAGNVLTDLTVANSPGVVPVPAAGTWVQLGDGVEVSFDQLAGGTFRLGDYWIFTARTAGRQVEELAQAAPFGIHHHYCRLAVVNANTAGWVAPIVEDCRPRPVVPDSCCTIIVRPGDDIQAAVDALPDAGGCICLKSGIHMLRDPVEIGRDNVEIHGESLGATVVALTGGAFVIGNGGIEGVRIHDVRFRQQAAAAPLITVGLADRPVICHCVFEAEERDISAGIAILARGARDLTVDDCLFSGFASGVWLSERCIEGRITNSQFAMGRPGGNTPATICILVEQTVRGVLIENNEIRRAVRGIIINDRPDAVPASLAAGSVVRGNLVGLTQAEGIIGRAIDVAAESAIIEGNRIALPGGNVVGIRACGSGSLVEGNIITVAGEGGINSAIFAGNEQDGQFLPLERIIIANNIISGRVNGIGLLGVSHARVAGNMLGAIGETIGIGIIAGNANDCVIADNHLIGSVAAIYCNDCDRASVTGNRIDGGQVGVMINNSAEPKLTGNRLRELSGYALVILGSTGRTELVDNRINRCGWTLPVAIGIGALLVYGELHVQGNEVVDIGLPPPGGQGVSAPIARGIVAEFVLEARVEGNLVTYTDPASRPVTAEDRALRMRGLLEMQINLGAEAIVFGFGTQIAHNKFIGTGASALVELLQTDLTDTIRMRFERVQFDDNYCMHISGPPNDQRQDATVSLVGRRCTVSGNHVKANTRALPSYHFHGMPGPFIGNVSFGPNIGRPAPFPAPENAFNQIA
jgi:nitrous oxidase accessory protein NosD